MRGETADIFLIYNKFIVLFSWNYRKSLTTYLSALSFSRSFTSVMWKFWKTPAVFTDKCLKQLNKINGFPLGPVGCFEKIVQTIWTFLGFFISTWTLIVGKTIGNKQYPSNAPTALLADGRILNAKCSLHVCGPADI